MEMQVGKRKIGDGYPAFIVAEMSANHQQDYQKAEAIVRAAAVAGADAIKLQTYTPDTMTIDSDKEWFRVGGKDNPQSWQGQTFYKLYKKAYTPWDWHPKLQKLAYDLGLVFFSTPFDETAVDFLESLKVPCYKIASYEATDIPLLRKVAKTGKPVIMSVGFATIEEIEYSVKILRENGCRELALLHCVTSYQEEEDVMNTNLATMQDLGRRFGVIVGFSDNMGGLKVPALAAVVGASIIEKHFVVRHDEASFDDRFSLDQNGFRELVKNIRWQEQVMGKVSYGPQTAAEEYNRQFRRSLFVVTDIKKGEKFTPQNLRSIRPGNGLPPKHYEEVLGKKATKDIERGTPLRWELIEN